MWAVGTGVAHSSILRNMKSATGLFTDRLWQFVKSKLSFDLLETRGSSYFFFGTYCVLSGEGSVLNGKSSLCELIIMQKSSLLKEALFFGLFYSQLF